METRTMNGGRLKEVWTKNTVIGLVLGQFLSLLITSTGFSSSELARRGINAPTSQSLLNYVLLAVIYGGIMIYRRKPLKAKWYYYVLLGLVDVEANYLVVKAYQYTSITSVMLLDCWSIPCVILLTWYFLKTKYKYRKFAGVSICVAGLVMVVFSDVHSADRTSGSHPIKGDLLVIAGATLYAVSNVAEEFFVKSADRIELMAFLGLFGAIVSACQISILERNELKSIHWSAGAAFPFFGFSLAMFLFYSLVPILLKCYTKGQGVGGWQQIWYIVWELFVLLKFLSVMLSVIGLMFNGATMLNLSLLTSDMWAVLIRIFAYHEKVDWMYFVAFVAVAIGLLVYSGSDKTVAEVANVEAERSKHLDEEVASSNLDRKDIAGSSRAGDTNSRQGFGSSRDDIRSSNLDIDQEAQGKKF